MADARSLLRQQRAARRIQHPLAAYSDAGKLLCTVCREHIKAESLWEAHLRAESHRQIVKSQAAAARAPVARTQTETVPAQEEHDDDAAGEMAQKRKLEDEDVDGDVPMEDYTRRKRSRPLPSPTSANTPTSNTSSEKEKDKDADHDGIKSHQQPTNNNLTPPSLNRRTSNTPSQGVELQMTSRPATPARQGSSSSTPLAAPATAALPSRQATNLLAAALSSAAESPATATGQTVDDDEWAAFEADIAAASYDTDAVISAPAMTAEQSAAAANNQDGSGDGGDENTQGRDKGAVHIEGEKEDATRALEDEFDEMEELEGRVRRLKEKREALRRSRAESVGQTAMDGKMPAAGVAEERGNAQSLTLQEEEDDDEDDDDDWDGFRFRAA